MVNHIASARKADVECARHDPVLCLAPGLFRTIKHGERKTGKLDIAYDYGSLHIEFSCPEPLGVDDLKVLQGLVALAGVERDTLNLSSPETEIGRKLVAGLNPADESRDETAVVVRDSLSRIAQAAGYAKPRGGSAIHKVRDAIERLWKVSILVGPKDGDRRGYRLVSSYRSRKDTGAVYVALNPGIAAAIIGAQRYVSINLREARQLKSDAARLLHQRLCAVVDLGRVFSVGIEKLVSYVWTEGASNDGVRRKYAWRIRRALGEIDTLEGWAIREARKGLYQIQRMPARALPAQLAKAA